MRNICLFVVALLCATTALAQPLPNGDFELWNIKYYANTDSGWFDSNGLSLASDDSLTVWRVPGFSGQAVRMESAIVGPDTLIAYISNKPGNQLSSAAGVPYTQKPAAITGYFRCNLIADTGLLWVRFKSAGVVVSNDTFKFTPGIVSTFTSFSFPLSLSVVPDTVIIVAASSDVLHRNIVSGSWLELDQLAFTGTGITQPIPGGSFDSWHPDTLQKPIGWQVGGNGSNTGVSRSTDFYSGSYAVALVTAPGGGPGGARPAVISTGTIGAGGPPTGGLPYTTPVDTLVGYYKYTPGGGTDSGLINVSLRKTGVGNVGGGRLTLPAASSYTYFEVPITSTMTPDTMRIDITSSKVGPGSAAAVGSILKVDKMLLRQNTPALAVTNNTGSTWKATVYPNPVTDALNINITGGVNGVVWLTLYDARGSVVMRQSFGVTTKIQLSTLLLTPGIYFYEVKDNTNIARGRFLEMSQ